MVFHHPGKALLKAYETVELARQHHSMPQTAQHPEHRQRAPSLQEQRM
jgi:hypothetical protein